MRSRGRNSPLQIAAVVLVTIAVVGFTYFHSDGGSTDAPRKTGNYTVADLPAQARQTLALIDKGGPYPYRQDNTVFGNRERLLPAEPSGYYREFTVATPGSDDRGARRLIRGKAGEIYYTNDHYASFHLVERN